MGQEPGSLLPGDERLEVDLSDEDRATFTRELFDVLAANDTAMPLRYQRWKQIKDAYNLVPDSARQGLKPDASKLVSEMTRSQVNTASARLEESLLGVRPFIKFGVWFDNEGDPETQQLVAQAKAAEEFFEHYADTDLQVHRWLPDAIHRSCKLGTAVAYVRWQVETKVRRFRAKNGGVERDASDSYGRIKVALVPNENMVVWPLHESEMECLTVVGHRTFYTPAEFRQWALSIKLPALRVAEIIAAATGDEGTTATSQDLAGKDIRPSGMNPFKGQIEITELWPNLPLPGKTESESLQVFLHEKSGPEKALLWIGRNAYHSGRSPYFDFQYWREDLSFWGSGIGHELVFNQAADSALMNLLIDNLKIISNYVRFLKAGSTAEALQDQIGPGMNIVTENPDEDIRFEALGGDLSHIYQAMDRNDMRGMKGTGVTAPLQGMGDPVLKSGASPSSLQMLINEANQKFGKVDKNFRRTLVQMFGFFFELIQQYAPDGLFYAKAPEGQADLLRRMKFQAPPGDVAKLFRIRVEAPSATSNREVLKQNIMVLYQLTVKHVELLLGLGQSVIAAKDPSGFEKFQRQTLDLVNELYKQIVGVHDVPGLGGVIPKVPAPTPDGQVINQLMQQVQQLGQQLQQKTQQLQAMQQPPGGPQMGGMPGGTQGQPMGAAGPQPGLPGPVPAPPG